MKPRLSKLFVKRTLLTGGIATPTGLLIDHWINDKKPEPLLEIQQPEVIGKEANDDGFLETVVTDQADVISELNERNDNLQEQLDNVKEEYRLSNEWIEDLEGRLKKYITDEVPNLKEALKSAFNQLDSKDKELDETRNELNIAQQNVNSLTQQLNTARTNETAALNAANTATTALKSAQDENQFLKTRIAADDTIFTLKDILDLKKVQRNIGDVRAYTAENGNKCVEYKKLYFQVESGAEGRSYTDSYPLGFCRDDFKMGGQTFFDNVYNWVNANQPNETKKN